jgi:hypothetical protein
MTEFYQKVGNTFVRVHAAPGAQLGQQPQAPDMRPASPQMDPRRLPQNVLQQLADGKFVTVPAWYTITMQLGGEAGSQQASSTTLRPERFFLYRVTCATDGDVAPFVEECGYSNQLRCVEVTWGDEFTRFFGEQPVMAACLFGDSNGFLDLVQPILFQGRQTLNARLRRFRWPGPEEPAITRWDISFQGLGVLPAGNEGGGSL